jgi:hypothetical protein
VENFEQKLTANFLFLINQTESDLPRLNYSSVDRLEELGTEWQTLEERAEELVEQELPALNRRLWELGIGAIWR